MFIQPGNPMRISDENKATFSQLVIGGLKKDNHHYFVISKFCKTVYRRNILCPKEKYFSSFYNITHNSTKQISVVIDNVVLLFLFD